MNEKMNEWINTFFIAQKLCPWAIVTMMNQRTMQQVLFSFLKSIFEDNN